MMNSIRPVQPSDAPPPPLGYHAALDGVRATAITMVLVSHSHPTFFKGGALGVDVFFALSGFLITTLLLQEMRNNCGPFPFRNFYARRSLRLFPALYSAIVVTVVYLTVRRDHLGGFLAMAGVETPYPWTKWASFVVGAATYTTNLIGVTATPGNLLGHTWSLAVEEQYYLLWPLVLVFSVSRARWRALMLILSVFIGLCLAARLVGVPASAGFLWNRPEAIAAGSLAALTRWYLPYYFVWLRRYSSVIASTGMMVIVLLSIAWGRVLTVQYDRGLFTVIGLVSAMTAWATVELPPDAVFRRILQIRPLVFLGTISYALYIWHIPVFRIVTWELPGIPGYLNILLKVSISLAIASLSTRLIERPFRGMQGRFRSSITVESESKAILRPE